MGAEWVRSIATGTSPLTGGQYSHIAVVGETAADNRDVIVEGPAGILATHPADFRPKYTPSNRRLTWPNGTIGTLYNATEPDQLRGPQHGAAWCDELAKWRYAQETWDMLQFGLRMGDKPKQAITTTPRPIPIIKQLLAQEGQGVYVTRGRTLDNRANLAPDFIRVIQRRYEGTRLGRQELDAEILDDVPGALWTRRMLDESRIPLKPNGSLPKLPVMQRIVVAIDPAITAPTDGVVLDETAETGIMVCGLGIDGRGYVFEDLTCRLGPDGWARRAVAGYDIYHADCIVAEVNQGGAMVESVLRSVRQTIPLQLVRASRGKVTRAEPVAALYAQGRISHVGTWAELEDQMVLFTPFGIEGSTTADRVDALVWAFTELFPALVFHVDDKDRVGKEPLENIGRSESTGY